MIVLLILLLCCTSCARADPGADLFEALVEQERALDAQLAVLAHSDDEPALVASRGMLEQLVERVARLHASGFEIGCFGALLWAQLHRLERLELWKDSPCPGNWRRYQAAARRCGDLRRQMQSGPPRGRAAVER